MGLLSSLKHPLSESIENLDGEDTYRIHREIILSKPFLLNIYEVFYGYLIEPFKGSELEKLKIVEIGAGGFNANFFYPTIITTDLHQTPFIKQIENAHALSFEDSSVDGLVMIDVLHHIPHPELFFKEVFRCLRPGGKLVMLEPYYGPWASLVYKNFHHEPWSDCEEWDIPLESTGRLSVANMKMPHNIFIRDIAKFKRLYPELEVTNIKKINFFYYLLSGGLSYRCLIPAFLGSFVFWLERLLKPLSSLLGMHMVVEIKKSEL
jgi:SAM-dependent methyltransferase